MPDVIDLKPHAPWRELRTTSTDWSSFSHKQINTMLATMHVVRAFEEKVLELASQRLVHGPAHSAIGQEGGAVGSIMALRPTDQINGSHRGHHQFLAKSLGYLAPEGLRANGEFTMTFGGSREPRFRKSWACPRAFATVEADPCTCAGARPAI